MRLFRRSTHANLAVLLITAAFCCSAFAQALPPRIFFSDLESGPATGGQNNAGAWVTIWGKGFGATRGTSIITVGGHAVAGYPIWSDTKVSFQLGRYARTGDIVVYDRANKLQNNRKTFTVRAGKIYIFYKRGSHFHRGSFL